MVGVDLPSLNNFRDLSAVTLAHGHFIRPNLLLRGASPLDLSTRDVSTLVSRVGLRTVLDLRSEEEAGKDTGARSLQAHAAVRTKHVNLLDAELIRGGAIRKLLAMPHYCAMLAALWLVRVNCYKTPVASYSRGLQYAGGTISGTIWVRRKLRESGRGGLCVGRVFILSLHARDGADHRACRRAAARRGWRLRRTLLRASIAVAFVARLSRTRRHGCL